MAGKNTAVFGLYPTSETLEGGVNGLRNAGFRNTDISYLMAENVGSKDLGHRKATKAPEGMATGAVIGVVPGAALGWFAASGTLTIPEIGSLVAGGPVVAALAAAGAAGILGGLIGGLIGLGMPEYEARRYEGRVRNAGNLLSVHCDDRQWTRRAIEVLRRTGAENISSAEEASADFARTDKPLPRNGSIDMKTMSEKRDV